MSYTSAPEKIRLKISYMYQMSFGWGTGRLC